MSSTQDDNISHWYTLGGHCATSDGNLSNPVLTELTDLWGSAARRALSCNYWSSVDCFVARVDRVVSMIPVSCIRAHGLLLDGWADGTTQLPYVNGSYLVCKQRIRMELFP